MLAAQVHQQLYEKFHAWYHKFTSNCMKNPMPAVQVHTHNCLKILMPDVCDFTDNHFKYPLTSA